MTAFQFIILIASLAIGGLIIYILTPVVGEIEATPIVQEYSTNYTSSAFWVFYIIAFIVLLVLTIHFIIEMQREEEQ